MVIPTEKPILEKSKQMVLNLTLVTISLRKKMVGTGMLEPTLQKTKL